MVYTHALPQAPGMMGSCCARVRTRKARVWTALAEGTTVSTPRCKAERRGAASPRRSTRSSATPPFMASMSPAAKVTTVTPTPPPPQTQVSNKGAGSTSHNLERPLSPQPMHIEFWSQLPDLSYIDTRKMASVFSMNMDCSSMSLHMFVGLYTMVSYLYSHLKAKPPGLWSSYNNSMVCCTQSNSLTDHNNQGWNRRIWGTNRAMKCGCYLHTLPLDPIQILASDDNLALVHSKKD